MEIEIGDNLSRSEMVKLLISNGFPAFKALEIAIECERGFKIAKRIPNFGKKSERAKS